MHDSCDVSKKGTDCCNSSLTCTARCIFAVPLVIFGILHFVNGTNMTSYLAGWPFALFFIYLSGAGLILGGLAIIINRYARLAAFLLTAEIGVFILAIHLPGVVQGGDMLPMAIGNMLKDVAIAGGALFIGAHSFNRGFSNK